MSALFVHQTLILAQKIDSREGFVLMQKGVSICMRQNEYLLG